MVARVQSSSTVHGSVGGNVDALYLWKRALAPLGASFQDALTLQRICLEKKQELCLDDGSEVPDVRASVQELMTSLYVATYNHAVSPDAFTASASPRLTQHVSMTQADSSRQRHPG